MDVGTIQYVHLLCLIIFLLTKFNLRFVTTWELLDKRSNSSVNTFTFGHLLLEITLSGFGAISLSQ